VRFGPSKTEIRSRLKDSYTLPPASQVRDLLDFLGTFEWSKSLEGGDFWSDVHSGLCCIEVEQEQEGKI
jgi:hypothetical protein